MYPIHIPEKMFPVTIGPSFNLTDATIPNEIPWRWLEKHEQRVILNHDQNLEQLALRGGLSPLEIVSIVFGLPPIFLHPIFAVKAFLMWVEQQDIYRGREVIAAYNELIYAVGKKFPGETRHETALRYLREAEARISSSGAVENKTS